MTVQGQYQIVGATARAIGESVEQAVAGGLLAEGAELPSVRALAQTLGVSPATVAAAYRTLRARGVVVSAERRGVRVASRPPVAVRAAGPLPAGVRDLATGNPDPALLPPLPALEPGARAAPGAPGAPARPAAPRRTRLYGEQVNLPALVDLAGDGFARDGIAADGIAVTSGALDGIERVLTSALRPGDRVALEDPGYTGVLDLVRALGLEPVGVKVDLLGPLPDTLSAALDEGVRAAVLTPRAHNPTGAAIDTARADELTEVLAAAPDVLLVEDDHAGAVAGAPYRTLSAGRARWAVVRSVSKSLGPDLRLAVVAADDGTLARVEGRQRLGPGWVSHLLQDLVARLWGDPSVATALTAAAETYARRRQALTAALAARAVGTATGDSGLNVWVPVPEEGLVVRGLYQAGWAVQAGEAYRLRAGPAVRITTADLEPPDAEGLADDLAALLRVPAATNRA